MTYVRIAEAAAASPIGTDLLKGDIESIRNYPRKLSGVGLTGSAAAGDAAVDVWIGDTKVASNLPNARTGGVIQVQTDVLGVNKIVPANERLQIKIATPSGTNPLYTHLFLSP